MQGTLWPAEWKTFEDQKTGLPVRQLTNYKGHSHHLYFTNPGWYDNGRKLLLGSDRDNLTTLMSLDMRSGELLQLTDKPLPPPPAESSFLFTCVNPIRAEAYFWRGSELAALDLNTLEERVIYRAPDGFFVNMLNCTADGKYVCTGIFEDLSDQFTVDLLHGYVGFHEYHAAHPLSQIVRVATDGSGAEIVWEENYWIGHVNTSPTQPHLLSFCHEGPWEKVDQRIWGLDLNSGKTWKIRPTEPGDRIGHEYWLADGESLGYHGHIGGQPVFGFVRYDNTQHQEALMKEDSWHFFSNTREFIVGDGIGTYPYLLLWRWRNEEIEPARILCRHRCSFHTQQTHVHPRFSADGSQVLFTSDNTGYGQLYLVDVPDFETLPLLES
jgi:oligogalacturonide lyase